MALKHQLHGGAGALLGAALVWLGAPRPACAAEPEGTQPAGEQLAGENVQPRMLRYPPSSVRVALIGGGLGLFAVPYAAGLISGFVWNDVPGADALKVPVVGPWIAIGQSGCAPDQDSCASMLALRGILSALDGLVQLGGLGLAAEGFFMTTEAEAESPAEPSSRPGAEASAPSALELGLAPVLGPTVVGVGVSGRF